MFESQKINYHILTFNNLFLENIFADFPLQIYKT